MRRYRVTFRSPPGPGCHLRSTNVAATSLHDAVLLAVRRLTSYPACRLTGDCYQTSVNGIVQRETGTVQLFTSVSAHWKGEAAEAWRYDVEIDEVSTLDLSWLVKGGYVATPPPLRP